MPARIRYSASSLFLTLFLLLAMAGQGRAWGVLVHDGKVFLGQDDNALVVLDARDGEALQRIRLDAPAYPTRAILIDDVLCITSGSGMVLLDARSGALRGILVGIGFTHHENTLFFLKPAYDSFVLAAYDVSQGEQLWEYAGDGKVAELLAAGKRVFAFRSSMHENSRLVCLDAVTGQALWIVSPDEGHAWLRAECSDDKVYVVDGEGDSHTATAETILVWDHDGVPQPANGVGPELENWNIYTIESAEIPIDRQLFPPKWSQRNQIPDWLRDEEERLLAEEPLRSIHTYSVAGNGALMAIRLDDKEATLMEDLREQTVVFYSPERKWSGRPGYLNTSSINGVDSVAADDNVVVLTSAYGTVECLDRETGESRWIYIFPTPRIELHVPLAFFVSPENTLFYTENLKRYRAEIAGHGVTGTVIDGETRTKPWKIITDPEPTAFYKDYRSVELVLIALHALCIVSALIDMWAYFHYRGRVQPGGLLRMFSKRFASTYSEALSYIVFIPLPALVYVSFGRYSPTLAALQVVCLGLFCLPVPCILSPRRSKMRAFTGSSRHAFSSWEPERG